MALHCTALHCTTFYYTILRQVVQLAAYGKPDLTSAARDIDALPSLRAAQTAAVLEVPYTGMTLGIDIGDAKGADAFPNPAHCNEFGGIHPRNKT